MSPYPTPSRAECEWAIELLKENNGNKLAAAREARLAESSFRHRLEVGERVYGLEIPLTPQKQKDLPKGRRAIEIINGIVYAGSDAHYWPGPPSTAHRAMCHFVRKERKQLAALVMNGDATDFPNISRHDVDWTETPSTEQELEAVAERLGELEKAGGKAPRFWTLGNHDARYERYIAKNASELKGVKGTSLSDHFPLWEPCYSLFVNDHSGGLVIKHRWKGGLHAAHNNAVNSGRSMATGHLHSQKVTPWSDYNGTRWGVDLGCMADPWGPQFQYCEDNPRNWRAGFARFCFVDGRLLTPELIRVVEDGVVEFRGELINV